MKIDIMLHYDRFGVQEFRHLGTVRGQFGGGTTSGQEPNQSDCDTIFVDF